jgi:RimJ/RimL family protein N-acetyltransferase
MYKLIQMTEKQLDMWFEIEQEAINEMLLAPMVTAGVPGDVVYYLSKANLIMGVPERWALRYFIAKPEEKRIVGLIGFRCGPNYNRIEIGYSVSPNYAGQGVATEAVKLLVGQSLETDPELDIYARVTLDNKASMKVLLNAGFKSEGFSVAEHERPVETFCYQRAQKTIDS